MRPYTINRAESLAFTTATGFLGFEVSDINTGKLLYTVPIKGFTAPASASAPGHGISLSPDEREVYVIDSSNSYAHVFDVSGLPATAPRQVADIALTSMAGQEAPCIYDAVRPFHWPAYSVTDLFQRRGGTGGRMVNVLPRDAAFSFCLRHLERWL